MNITSIFVELINTCSNLFGDNVGLGIIAVTILIRTLLLPIVIPSLKSMKKMQSLSGEISALKEKYGSDKETFAKKQMELYQQHGVNPLGGCSPQLVQIGLFIAFYHVLVTALKSDTTLIGSYNFLGIDITKPDSSYISPILTGLTQFILGVMILPATSTKAEMTKASKTATNKDDKDSVDMESMAKTMQLQMIVVMPIITLIAALQFPSGLALYWVSSTLFSIIQQYFVSGWGGLKLYAQKFGIIKE